MKNTVTKYLFILLALALILLITISYLLYLKKSTPQAPAFSGKPGQEETASPSTVTSPVEGTIGPVTDVSSQPDGQVKITVEGKEFLFPADQQVKLYTSEAETTSVPINQLKQGTMVNVIKFTNPDHYEIVGVTDKALKGKLI